MMPASTTTRRTERADRLAYRRATRREIAAHIGIWLIGILAVAIAGVLAYGIAILP